MGLTSEQAHWIVGGELAALALALMLYETRVVRFGALRYALAAALLLFAAEGVCVPVLAGWAHPGHIDAATVQHFILAAICLVVGALELLRTGGWLHDPLWRASLPLGMLVAGVIFVFHAQHATKAPPILLTVQHRILGASLAVGAVSKTVAELPSRKARPFAVAWLVPLLLAAVQLLLYREGGGGGG